MVEKERPIIGVFLTQVLPPRRNQSYSPLVYRRAKPRGRCNAVRVARLARLVPTTCHARRCIWFFVHRFQIVRFLFLFFFPRPAGLESDAAVAHELGVASAEQVEITTAVAASAESAIGGLRSEMAAASAVVAEMQYNDAALFYKFDREAVLGAFRANNASCENDAVVSSDGKATERGGARGSHRRALEDTTSSAHVNTNDDAAR